LKALQDMPVSTWLAFRPFGCGLWHVAHLFVAVALYFISKQRERLAAIALAASMIPGGLGMMEAVSQPPPIFHLPMWRDF